MTITQKEVRKTLYKKIKQLNDIIADIDVMLTKMETHFYRVAIFGSARMKQDTKLYKDVYELAYQLSMRGGDIVTGGGPGLMEAASRGAKDGGNKTRSIGLHIELPFEHSSNGHLDVKVHHRRFSSRLDEFMRISHAVIVTPGGIGTLLELFYTWQLIQVEHIKERPIILLGAEGMWHDLLRWLEKWPLKLQLLSPEDMTRLTVCENIDAAVKLLEPEIEKFKKIHQGSVLENHLPKS